MIACQKFGPSAIKVKNAMLCLFVFAGDLSRMYIKFTESKGWEIEVMSMSISDTGGLEEIILLISRENVYKIVKFESEVHCRQRVSTTQANGRIHTSAAPIAVLP
jgi:peptide chain release factor 1